MTGYVYEERYAWHDPGSISLGDKWVQPGLHWENAETKTRIHSLLCVSGAVDRMTRIRARACNREELERFHTKEYVDKLENMSTNNLLSESGDCATFSKFGLEIACLSAGGVLAAVESVVSGKIRNAYCLVRPPGHHAEPDRGMGFCLLNNVGIAALHAQSLGLSKVAIVDYDVHHGNGTEKKFLDDDSVLFISVHQANNYPVDTGDVIPGSPYTINVPLPPGSGSGAYSSVFERLVEPRVKAFQPDLILVSSGFDASFCDPLGQMMLSSDDYYQIAKSLVNTAESVCGGKIVFCHEGGYSKEYTPFCGLSVVKALLKLEEDIVEDPYLYEVKNRGYQHLQQHQKRVIDLALEASHGLGQC